MDRKVFKPELVADERHVGDAGGAVPLFGDNDLRFARFALRVAGVFRGVVLRPVKHEDNVRILLDSARFAQIGKKRAFVRPALVGAGELGQECEAPSPAP